MAKDLDKELGFEPVSDESLGMEVSPEDKAKLQAYLKSQGPSIGASVLAGAQQGLTLQHAPQLGAAMGAGLEKALGCSVWVRKQQMLRRDYHNKVLKIYIMNI
jgi:hypothetical protein